MTRIFISYRRDDSGMAAGRIYDHLVSKFGGDALFMDVASIDGGDDFVETIERAVSGCDVLVAVIGT
ncbi:MAG: toll/interleukin-1 receptor domain-containing protein, partial [Anaerolineae bacterium]